MDNLEVISCPVVPQQAYCPVEHALQDMRDQHGFGSLLLG